MRPSVLPDKLKVVYTTLMHHQLQHCTLLVVSYHGYSESIEICIPNWWSMSYYSSCQTNLWQILSTGSVLAPCCRTEMKLHTGGCLAVCMLISFWFIDGHTIYCVLMCFTTLAAIVELLDNAVDEVKIPCPLPSRLDGAQRCYILDKMTSSSSCAIHVLVSCWIPSCWNTGTTWCYQSVDRQCRQSTQRISVVARARFWSSLPFQSISLWNSIYACYDNVFN